MIPPRPSRPPPSELWAAFRAYRGVFLGVAAVSVFINVLMLVSPLYMMQIYDRVLASRNQTTLVMITLAAIILYVVYASLEALRSRTMVRVGILLDEPVIDQGCGGVEHRRLDRVVALCAHLVRVEHNRRLLREG